MLIELVILVAVTSCLMVALAPATRAVRRSRRSTIGGAAPRELLGPRALRRGLLTPVLGGPARMPIFRSQMVFAGVGQLSLADAPAPAARRRTPSHRHAAAIARQGAELVATSQGRPARTAPRSKSRDGVVSRQAATR